MDSVVEGREEHSPGGHYTAHQNIDGEEKKGGCVEGSPAWTEGMLTQSPSLRLRPR